MPSTTQLKNYLSSLTLALLAVLFFGLFANAASDDSMPAPLADSGLYLKVVPATPVKLSKLKPGDVVHGNLSSDVYSADRKLFPSGSEVKLTVDHLERRRSTPNDRWPGVVKLFAPRHENYPLFNRALITHEGQETSVNVRLISVSRNREIFAKGKKAPASTPVAQGQDRPEPGAIEVTYSNAKKPSVPTLVLEASEIETNPGGTRESVAPPSEAGSESLPAGTRCKILLLGNISASKSQPGDTVRARLLEPVALNSKVVLPPGSLFEGTVVKKTPPRWLSRAGSLYMTFTTLTLPDGSRHPVAASLTGAELDEKSHTKMDAEGRLHGEHPGKAWMAINLGVTVGAAKVADDTLQLIIEAIVSTATDVSTAGTGRIVAGCVSGLFMATRRGRDIVLPRFTEMQISLDRPVSLRPLSTTSAVGGGK